GNTAVAQQEVDRALDAPAGVTDRLRHWTFYAEGITSSPKAFLLGHANPPDREVHPSAHNYWLDALYNFGFVAMAPLLGLLLWTLASLWRHRRAVLSEPVLLATALAALYMIL